MSGGLKVGAAEVVITPPIGVELGGYGPGLERRSTAVHRQLTAQALVLQTGSRRIALVACDLLTLTPQFVARVRALVEAATGIAPGDLMICCTHSHTAPTIGNMRELGRADVQYVGWLARTLAGAVSWATRRLVPATLSVGRLDHHGLAWNRTGRGETDFAVHTVHATNEAGEVVAAIGQYACHPVVLGPRSIISPDFPGGFRARVLEAHPECVVMFLNGACGDIDPVSNKAAWGQGTVDDADRFGRELAETALAAMDGAELLDSRELAVARSTLELAFNPPTAAALRERISRYSKELAERGGGKDDAIGAPADGEPRLPAFWLRYYRSLERRLRRAPLDGEVVELQAMRLADGLVLLGLPAEVYAEHGLLIKAHGSLAHTIPVCYANGCCGYIPPTREFGPGAYSAALGPAVYDRPPFRADVADRLMAGAKAILDSLPA